MSEFKKNRTSAHFQLVIAWNGLTHFANAHPKYINEYISQMGLPRIPIKEGMEYEVVLASLQQYIGHKFGFMLEKENYQRRFYPHLKQIISYAELGYQQNLNR